MNKQEELKKNGFLLIKNFFSVSDVETVFNDIKEIFTIQFIYCGFIMSGDEIKTQKEFDSYVYKLYEYDYKRFLNVGKNLQHIISLYKLSMSEKIISLLQEFGLSFPNICTRPVLHFNQRKIATKSFYYKTPIHQDWGNMQGSSDSLVLWTPFVNIFDELGPLEFIPMSHKDGLMDGHFIEGGFWKPNKIYKEEEWAQAKLNKGDLLIFSSFLVHRSGDNISDCIRWSTHWRYNNLNDTTFIERGFISPYKYIPADKLEH